MEEKTTKRKTTTSTAVKARYNKKVYDRITLSVPKETAARFREKCRAEGVSQAQILKAAIDEYLSK